MRWWKKAAIAAVVFASTGFVAPAFAQLDSSKTIRIIVPFAPAGSSDVLARLLQQPLQQELKENVMSKIGPARAPISAPPKWRARRMTATRC